MKQTLSILALLAAAPALAESTRQLDAHEHGVGALNIAIDNTTVAMELKAPGADIVGFEYAAKSEKDRAAVKAALKTLEAPLALFKLPEAAGCAVTMAKAELETEDGHEGHDHDDHGHDDHDKEHHDEHAHDDREHGKMASHTEFHAEYMLTCDNTDALNSVTFAYFETFPNAKEVEVQMITANGAIAFEVERDAPVLDLGR